MPITRIDQRNDKAVLRGFFYEWRVPSTVFIHTAPCYPTVTDHVSILTHYLGQTIHEWSFFLFWSSDQVGHFDRHGLSDVVNRGALCHHADVYKLLIGQRCETYYICSTNIEAFRIYLRFVLGLINLKDKKYCSVMFS